MATFIAMRTGPAENRIALYEWLVGDQPLNEPDTNWSWDLDQPEKVLATAYATNETRLIATDRGVWRIGDDALQHKVLEEPYLIFEFARTFRAGGFVAHSGQVGIVSNLGSTPGPVLGQKPNAVALSTQLKLLAAAAHSVGGVQIYRIEVTPPSQISIVPDHLVPAPTVRGLAFRPIEP